MRLFRALASAAFLCLLCSAAPTSASAAAQGVRAGITPPGFDTGNQTPFKLVMLAENVPMSSVASSSPCFSAQSISPTDNVSGPHGSTDPLGLVAWRGVTEFGQKFGNLCKGLGPADPSLAAGGGFVVEAVNDNIAIYDRAGNLKVDVRTGDFFSQPTSDPKVAFDPLPSPHWYITDLVGVTTQDNGDQVDLAVSHGADPTGAWDNYKVEAATPGNFDDQPKIGFSFDKVLIDWTQFHCEACFADDHMVVIQKSDLDSFMGTPQAVDINMSTETNKRKSVTPAIPLPSAEVNDAFAAYRGHDLSGTYASTMVFIGTPATKVAFKETGPKIEDTNDPPLAAQPGVSPDQVLAGDDRMESVSLVSASPTAGDFSGTLWTAGATKCKPKGSARDRDCLRIDKIEVNSSGDAKVKADFNIGQDKTDLLYPAVVGDISGRNVWVSDTRMGSVDPTSERSEERRVGKEC